MNAGDDRVNDPELVDLEEDGEEDEFADAQDEEVSAELDGFDDSDGDDGDDEASSAVAAFESGELSSKEQSAKSLQIRRAIETRMEERQFHEDIDYLDYDLDD